MAFSKHEYWSGLPFPTPGDLPDPGIEPSSLASLDWQADSIPPSLLEAYTYLPYLKSIHFSSPHPQNRCQQERWCM